MARSKRLLVPVLVGLLVAVLLGPAGGAATATAPRLAVASIMIPAGAFTPDFHERMYSSGGGSLTSIGNGAYQAPVTFPVPVVNIRKVVLYAHDNDAAGPDPSICLQVLRTSPPGGTVTSIGGETCTTGASSQDPQLVTASVISPRRVDTSTQGLLIWVVVEYGLRIYGAKVVYTYETGA